MTWWQAAEEVNWFISCNECHMETICTSAYATQGLCQSHATKSPRACLKRGRMFCSQSRIKPGNSFSGINRRHTDAIHHPPSCLRLQSQVHGFVDGCLARNLQLPKHEDGGRQQPIHVCSCNALFFPLKILYLRDFVGVRVETNSLGWRRRFCEIGNAGKSVP